MKLTTRRSRQGPTKSTAPWVPGIRKPLRRQVAVVAGGTRGAGRGIAVSLGAAGATVYVTGRSTKGHLATPGRPETIEETVDLIQKFGGRGIALRVDHTVEREVRRLFDRVSREQHGRLDILVNDIWGSEELTEWGTPPWKMSVSKGLEMLERAVHSHLITSRYGIPLMVRRRRGLVVEITDGDHDHYRGSFYYDLVKSTVIRIARNLAEEFDEARLAGLTALAVTPGFLRSEYILDQFGVTERNWRNARSKVAHFHASESPYYIGRSIVALAADPRVHQKAGKVIGTWDLAREYHFTDLDGSQPNWGKVFSEEILPGA
jgi:NAD(P)-dependent dehydrogenase (short-subunit alcohol dehydrogenase family)